MFELINEPGPEEVVAAVLPLADFVLSVPSALLLLLVKVVPVIPVMTVSLADDVGVAFVSVRMVRALVEGEKATGIVDAVGLPNMETIPDKSMVEAAFASALAVGGKPKTLHMFAMAPNVAVKR